MVASAAFPSAANLSREGRANSAVELRGFGCDLVVGISSLRPLRMLGCPIRLLFSPYLQVMDRAV